MQRILNKDLTRIMRCLSCVRQYWKSLLAGCDCWYRGEVWIKMLLSHGLQVLTINAVGPFILTAKLKPLLKQSPFERKFVVNVSAMEGQFSRVSKGHRHPHTNMAKAALNMMTRTSGLEYQMDGIYMTAVDTGWVTDERPFYQSKWAFVSC